VSELSLVEKILALFFDLHDVHRQAADHALMVPFADAALPILGSTELTVFKMRFSRPKDWVDIQAMFDAGSLDVGAITSTYGRIMGADDVALGRLHDLARAHGA